MVQAFKKYSSTGKIRRSKDYGVSYKETLELLNNTLPKDFNEKNYVIDHIRPLCSFDLTDPEQVKIAFSPENHRWLLAEENARKVSSDLKQRLKIRSRC